MASEISQKRVYDNLFLESFVLKINTEVRTITHLHVNLVACTLIRYLSSSCIIYSLY